MAINTTHVDASVETLYRILLDPYAYPRWVVGVREVRGVDPEWPRPGSSFHHTPVVKQAKDRSEMIELETNQRVVLNAYLRPFGVARVTIELQPEARGTKVCLKEEPAEGTKMRGIKPVVDLLSHLRNIESLRRLRKVVEETERSSPSPDA